MLTFLKKSPQLLILLSQLDQPIFTVASIFPQFSYFVFQFNNLLLKLIYFPIQLIHSILQSLLQPSLTNQLVLNHLILSLNFLQSLFIISPFNFVQLLPQLPYLFLLYFDQFFKLIFFFLKIFLQFIHLHNNILRLLNMSNIIALQLLDLSFKSLDSIVFHLFVKIFPQKINQKIQI